MHAPAAIVQGLAAAAALVGELVQVAGSRRMVLRPVEQRGHLSTQSVQSMLNALHIVPPVPPMRTHTHNKCRWDLCAGPHVERTGAINPDALDLESVAGEGSGFRERPTCKRIL